MFHRYPSLDLPAVALALAVWLWSAWPVAHGAPPPAPAAPVTPPAAACGMNLVLEAALPAPRGRGNPERLWLRNLEPTPVALDSYHVTNGRHRRPLVPAPGTAQLAPGLVPTLPTAPTGPIIIAPGALIEVRPPRLRNADGYVALVDPCGLIFSALTWEDVPHDAIVLSAIATDSRDAHWRDKTASAMVSSQRTSRSDAHASTHFLSHHP